MSARKTALTAIRQPIDEIAAVVWERLSARMRGEQSQPRQTVLNVTLQMRKSVLRREQPLRDGFSAPATVAVAANAGAKKGL
jgi:LacI family transcriptional regulator